MKQADTFWVVNSPPIQKMRQQSAELDIAIRDFENKHGVTQVELVLLLVYGIRHVKPIDQRLVLGFDLANGLLDLAISKGKTDQAVRAALRRHVENHAMKAEVFDWLDRHFIPGTKSMDDVAFELAGKLVPAKFRAVRDWMTEWKKQRPARTA